MNGNEILTLLEKVYSEKNNRYNTWKYCYHAFEKLDSEQEDDLLALNLAFYLASWGMYRGSSGLLQKDYKVHVPAIGCIRRYKDLRCRQGREVSINDLPRIKELIHCLKLHYGSITYLDENDSEKRVSATDTLISKIILGTLSCLPAFDRYFVDGINVHQKGFNTMNDKSLAYLFEFLRDNEDDLNSLQLEIQERYQTLYPVMKIIDLYFWYEGFLKS